MEKRETVDIFRQRLEELIARTGLSRSKFAARCGLDRSTLSQLLSPANVRLPRVETISSIATRHAASVDWLIGLSQSDQVGTDIIPQLAIEPDTGAHADERLLKWHREARGYKVRYVPATLPDQLKTEAMMSYECAKLSSEAARAWSGIAEARAIEVGNSESEIEVCSSLQCLEQFIRGEGVWRDMKPTDREAGLKHMAEKVEEYYPTFRWFLYDGRARFSVPYTVFGPVRAAIYIGEMYFVFTSTEHIRELSRHFDNLIRSAIVQPDACASLIKQLAGQAE